MNKKRLESLEFQGFFDFPASCSSLSFLRILRFTDIFTDNVGKVFFRVCNSVSVTQGRKMCIDAQRGPHVRMSEKALRGFDVDTGAIKHGAEGMSKIVTADGPVPPVSRVPL